MAPEWALQPERRKRGHTWKGQTAERTHGPCQEVRRAPGGIHLPASDPGPEQSDDRGIEGTESPGTEPLPISAGKLQPSLFLVDSETRRGKPLLFGSGSSFLPDSIHSFVLSIIQHRVIESPLFTCGPAGLSTGGCRVARPTPRPRL